MSSDITLVGIGPGSPDYLLPVARREIEKAQVLVGGREALKTYALKDQDTFPITGKLEKVISYLEQVPSGKKVVVLVSGDPGFYSFLSYLKEKMPSRELKVIPGISAFQVAFARIRSSWHEASLFSLHGRRIENLVSFIEEKLREVPRVAFLTDNHLTPDEVARILLEEGFPGETPLYVLTDLTLPTEKVERMSLEEAARKKEKGNSVVVLGDV
ncbi:MAG: precorrin-6y C5,15-methyltransferase (decarboxylating) subunit CbiE [Candidatus Syntrophonatronum acetioxidans]|uniref:Precorrin-6y C5,15-methyltransferase (Decarboxylating) subunit CbiE n=1 Tax=Candidatus Syntrophonatronum acetioxidans TaxID=1795816 RepID=A0A424YIY1_9FIRM|nr:MAG: precorrin-6y C5,15-methyltransferase (decarboxylating) subunit CbiE [Candidatus Syntrophonatronum acetioxidans]